MRSRASLTRSERSAALARAGVLLAVASVLGLAETLWLPALPVPGTRIGLANIAVLVALLASGWRTAAFVSFGRVFVVGLATGSLVGPVGAMSFAGALASLVVMAALAAAGQRFSPIGISVAGSAASVCAQVTAACVVAGTAAPAALLPLSLTLSLPSGLAVGILAGTLLSRVSRQSVLIVG